MYMSVRDIQMNEMKGKNDHLVITHQPFAFLHPLQHVASDIISRALVRRKEKLQLLCFPPFFIYVKAWKCLS